jgi:SHS2 domain-containing protein
MAADAGFEIFAVTADKGILAWGPERPSVFRQAALGLWSLMVDPATVECRSGVPLTVEAEGREALLVAWLNDLLYLYEAKGFIGCDCEVQSLTETRLVATVRGETVDSAHHVILSHVKAVTYHQLHVGPTASGWEGRVVVDV